MKIYNQSYNESCHSHKGEIDLTVIGNSSSYNYLWNNNSVSEDLQNLVAGTYQVTVYSGNCNTSKSIEITVYNYGEIPKPVIYQSANILSTDEYDYYTWYYGNTYLTDGNTCQI